MSGDEFPDLERVIIPLLKPLVGDGKIANRTPYPLPLPFIRIQQAGGPRDQLQGIARIDVQVFAATSEGKTLAETIDSTLVCTKFHFSVDDATTDVGPTEVPWADPNVRTWVASYRMTCRRR